MKLSIRYSFFLALVLVLSMGNFILWADEKQTLETIKESDQGSVLPPDQDQTTMREIITRPSESSPDVAVEAILMAWIIENAGFKPGSPEYETAIKNMETWPNPFLDNVSLARHISLLLSEVQGGRPRLARIISDTSLSENEKRRQVGTLLGEASKRLAGRRKPSFINSLNMKFVYIPPGVFMMGHLKEQDGGDIGAPDETPHLVTLTRGFYIQTTEVTQSQWEQVMEDSVAKNTGCGDDCPVEFVPWEGGSIHTVQGFIDRLNKMEETDKYRLPTEAEWEYACRAGTTTSYHFGENEGKLGQFTWYRDNAGGATRPVAMKKPNPWGLYDMLGNVQEWCSDWYSQFSLEPITDPIGPELGKDRVVRGGSSVSYARDCRCSKRFMRPPTSKNITVGFRLVKSP